MWEGRTERDKRLHGVRSEYYDGALLHEIDMSSSPDLFLTHRRPGPVSRAVHPRRLGTSFAIHAGAAQPRTTQVAFDTWLLFRYSLVASSTSAEESKAGLRRRPPFAPGFSNFTERRSQRRRTPLSSHPSTLLAIVESSQQWATGSKNASRHRPLPRAGLPTISLELCLPATSSMLRRTIVPHIPCTSPSLLCSCTGCLACKIVSDIDLTGRLQYHIIGDQPHTRLRGLGSGRVEAAAQSMQMRHDTHFQRME